MLCSYANANHTDSTCCVGVPVMPSVRDHYQAEARFKQSPETKAIVDAKYQ